MMAVPSKGNPQTFKGGTLTIAPWMIDGVPQANATSANLVITSGSWSNDGAAVEVETNTFGRLVVSGNRKVEVSLSAFVSQANLTAPLANGTDWTIKTGDYANVTITAGTFSAQGIFMISQEDTTLDPNEIMNLDLTLMSHGDITVNTKKIVTG